ncbi:MAG: hypothetical protein J5959_06325, partial [Butyrivibrio sp.]|nr:hypothetical protein [Butyrivibrio sp.]
MRRSNKKLWAKSVSFAMSAFMVFSGVGFAPENVLTVQAEESLSALTDEEISALTANSSFKRTSVHDPSIVYDNAGTYYVFGSHMGVSKST